jgi:hypothetical protein
MFTAAIAVIFASVILLLIVIINVMLWSNFFNITCEYYSCQYRTLSAAKVGYVYLGLLTLVYTKFYSSNADIYLFILAKKQNTDKAISSTTRIISI